MRWGTFDAVGDGNPVPERAGCPRLEGHAPDRVQCPRRHWWLARRWWGGGVGGSEFGREAAAEAQRYGRRWRDDDAVVRRRCRAHAAPESTSRPPRRQRPTIPRASQEDIEVAGVPFAADGATPSRPRPNGARWRGRGRLSVSRTRRGALSAPDLPDITQVTARNRLKMPQIPRRDL